MLSDSRTIVLELADRMRAHRNKLAGKTAHAIKAYVALDTTARAVADHRAEHKKQVAETMGHWSGKNAEAFERRARRLTRWLDETAESTEKGATVVASTAATLDGGHQAIVRLIDEYADRAAPLLDAGRQTTLAGGRGALVKAIGEVVRLRDKYTRESIRTLRAVHAELKDSAATLRKLERVVEHDGIVDPKRRNAKGNKGDKDGDKGGGKLRRRILDAARGQLGYREGPGNANKYGPDVAWCSSFATWVWRKSGVDIPILPFTGDVYRWGQEHGLAYGKNNLDAARPGDVLLFGTGPESTSSSTHIGIVEKVDGNQVTLIEGNSSDRVQRVTHTLSSSTFYGGVHPT